MSKLRFFIAAILATSSIVIAAPAAFACQGPDGEPCPGARECQSVNALSDKLLGEQIMACPT